MEYSVPSHLVWLVWLLLVWMSAGIALSRDMPLRIGYVAAGTGVLSVVTTTFHQVNPGDPWYAYPLVQAIAAVALFGGSIAFSFAVYRDRKRPLSIRSWF